MSSAAPEPARAEATSARKNPVLLRTGDVVTARLPTRFEAKSFGQSVETPVIEVRRAGAPGPEVYPGDTTLFRPPQGQ